MRPVVFLVVFFNALLTHAEVTQTSASQPLRLTLTSPSMELNFDFGFPPRRGEFATPDNIPGYDSLTETEKINQLSNLARCNADSYWNSFNYADQAGFISDTYKVLMKAHREGLQAGDPSYDFSPRILTCKAFKESNFNTQIGNFYGSSAVGLSQVLQGTLDDLFSERVGFRSRVPGYENIKTGQEMLTQMARNPTLQLEVGLAVLEMKRDDNSYSGANIQPILESYLGSSNPDANAAYARSIYDCAYCVQQNNESYSLECLCKTKPDDKNCMAMPSGGTPTCAR